MTSSCSRCVSGHFVGMYAPSPAPIDISPAQQKAQTEKQEVATMIAEVYGLKESDEEAKEKEE